MEKFVYSFKEGNRLLKNKLGGKGVNLCEMTKMKLPIPVGFIITTEACNLFLDNNYQLPKNIQKEIFEHLLNLENKTKKKFGDVNQPLLVSVRSGAIFSMPGMMDTILNIGLNDKIIANYEETDEYRFYLDSYRRFIGMYGEVVEKIPYEKFAKALKLIQKEKQDQDLTVTDLKKVIDNFQQLFKQETKKTFPQDPLVQLTNAIKAVFRSWDNERAVTYRKMNNISNNLGTAVTVQEMVFGNKNNNCGTGVVFSRNCATGENQLYGEFLLNAQGEDVVAGIRTPKNINELEKLKPDLYKELQQSVKNLEKHYRDVQDVEFTIEDNKLYILQTRTGKRTIMAALKIAVDMVKEGLIAKEEAVLRIDANQVEQALHANFDTEELKKTEKLTKGIAASPGAATGRICFSKEKIQEFAKKNEPTILVRLETSPEDIEAMNIANGVMTVYGGMTSHAAVVARGMGICCVSGCSEITLKNNKIYCNSHIVKEGDFISIDGNTGIVYIGKIKTKAPKLSEEFHKILKWAHDNLKMKVYANADTPEDAGKAREFLAMGIGLCRTEHMFFQEKRILAMQKMILAENDEIRQEAIIEMEKYHQKDFYDILKTMDNLPVVIRFLDPPLHEFMPNKDSEIKILANYLKISQMKLKNKINNLKEVNPMMGHRGARVSVTYPELLKMQTRAIIKAATKLQKEGQKPQIELMLPLIITEDELLFLINIIKQEANQINDKIKFKVGAMIEVPRAVLIADKIASQVDFVSFGTNDLTQMTFGFSRDDMGKFINDYYENNLINHDPFVTLDIDGVGQLIKQTLPSFQKIAVGICGEHGGNPESITFFYQNKFTYVSCSTYRVPIAIIKAAQLAINENEKTIEKISIKE